MSNLYNSIPTKEDLRQECWIEREKQVLTKQQEKNLHLEEEKLRLEEERKSRAKFLGISYNRLSRRQRAYKFMCDQTDLYHGRMYFYGDALITRKIVYHVIKFTRR